MLTLKLIPCGTKVKITLANIEGIITGITIRFKAIAYEVSYFSGVEYKQVWLNECEFETEIIARDKIGFVKA